MDWNPNTHQYCVKCQYYEPEGQYIYILEREPKARKCKHLARCKRVHDIDNKSQQLKMF